MKGAVTTALVCLLTGCESMSPYEEAWQVMHLADVAMTINGPASDPCYREQNAVTRSLIGSRPHRDAVLAWGAGMAVAHYFAGRWLDNSDWPEGVKTVIRSIDLGYKGVTISNNHNAGIRLFGDNTPCAPPPTFDPDAQPWK